MSMNVILNADLFVGLKTDTTELIPPSPIPGLGVGVTLTFCTFGSRQAAMPSGRRRLGAA